MLKKSVLFKLADDTDSASVNFDPFHQDDGWSYSTNWSTPSTAGMSGSASPFGGSAGFASIPFGAYSLSSSSAPSGGDLYITTGGSGLSFHDVFESGVSSDFIRCITAAETEMESLFTSTLHLSLDFKATNSGNNGFALTNSWSSSTAVNYATLKAALPASDVLPATDPNPGSGNDWYLPEAYGRMLGLSSSTPTFDDTVSLNTFYNWTYGQDVINGVIHEITEGGMGRVGGLGDQNGVWSTMDLFRYTGPKGAGTLDTTDGRDGKTTYFSSDGGKTGSTLTFNNQYTSASNQANTGDPADWSQQSVFGSTNTGETLSMTQDELNVMAALGWAVKLPEAELFGTSGDWQSPSSWFAAYPPIQVQDVYVKMNSGAIGTSQNDVTVYSIGSSFGSTLDITGYSTLTATHGTILNTQSTSNFGSNNDGTIRVYTGSTLEIGYGFTNTGILDLGYATTGTGTGTLKLDTAITKLDGSSGVVNLGVGVGSSFTSGAITGYGLINATNFIAGGGSIKLLTLDNQVGGTIEATHTAVGSNSLKIQADTFTNEGKLFSFAGTTLGLGSSSVAEAMINTGTVVAGATGAGNLAITGNYTISGSGSVILKGAGSAILSDGAGAAKLTNNSTITSQAGAQVGDSGILSVNDLTLVNTGTVKATVSGALTLNTGSNVINDGGGKLIAGSGATLVVLSNVTTGTAGAASSGGTIEANAGGTVTIASSITNGVASPSVAGQVVVDAGGRVEIKSGGSISVPLDINGTSGSTAGGIATLDAGGAIDGAITFESAGATLNLNSTASAIGVCGSGGSINLSSAQANVTGGDDTITFTGGSGNAGNLYTTGATWDSVYGSNGTVNVNAAKVNVIGGDDVVSLVSGSGNIVELYSTANNWDNVYGSNGVIALNDAQVNVTGGGDIIDLQGPSGNIVELYSTASNWDNVNSSNGVVALNDAQANVIGGGDVVDFRGPSGNIVELYATNNTWDYVYGSNGEVALNNAQVNVIGGSDLIDLQGATGNIVEIYSTANNWDTIKGSNAVAVLNNAQANVIGGDDMIDFGGSTGNVVELYSTSNNWDSVFGSNGVVALNSAQSNVSGNSNTIFMQGSTGNLLGAYGNSDTINFSAALGATSVIGFNATDVMSFTKSDFAGFQALQAAMTQSGSDTLITLDVSDTVTLTNTIMSNLMSSQFQFV